MKDVWVSYTVREMVGRLLEWTELKLVGGAMVVLAILALTCGGREGRGEGGGGVLDCKVVNSGKVVVPHLPLRPLILANLLLFPPSLTNHLQFPPRLQNNLQI